MNASTDVGTQLRAMSQAGALLTSRRLPIRRSADFCASQAETIASAWGGAYRRVLMRLTQADLKAILGFLADADRIPPVEPYPVEIFHRLRTLIPFDSGGYEQADLEARRFLDDGAPGDEIYWAAGPCPITDYRARTGDLSALRMSDVISRSRYHALPLYHEYYQPVGLDHIMDLGLSTVRTRYRTLTLVRGRDVPDFSERDRAVLELLRPHLRAREARATLLAAASGRTDLAVQPAQHVEANLTAREREIVGMVAAGKTNAQIAAELWVTPGTVKKHLEHVYAKLGVSGRAAAATTVQSTASA